MDWKEIQNIDQSIQETEEYLLKNTSWDGTRDWNFYQEVEVRREKQEDAKETGLLTAEYLINTLGFHPFCEDGELQFYSKNLNCGTIALEPPRDAFGLNNNGWSLRLIHGAKYNPYFGNVYLTCRCNTIEQFRNIFNFFIVKI